jgi:hypothetical protein
VLFVWSVAFLEIGNSNKLFVRLYISMRKQLDHRIPILIDNNVKKNHRSFIVLVGDRGKDQVSFIHFLLSFASDILLDCEPPFPAFASASVCAAFCAVVLQERPGIYEVGEE